MMVPSLWRDYTTAVKNAIRRTGTKFGEVRAVLFDAGTPAPDSDLLNGAVALVHHLTMVTHNTAHYLNIPGLLLDAWLGP
jgi:predicted nucleic acid-binding protein